MKFERKKRAANDELPSRRRTVSSADESSHRQAPADLTDRYAFRRNRTLTGSSSAHVASSNELNAQLRSPRAHVHHLTSLRRRLLLYFSTVAVAAFGLYILLAQTVATEDIRVKGVVMLQAADSNAYKESMEAYYAARPTERLRFLLDTEQMTSHLQAAHPEIDTISVDPAGLGEAVVTITARQPIAHWSMAGSNQYVDGEGVVFARNYFADPTLQIVDNSGLRADTTGLVASNRFLGFVGRTIAAAGSRDLTVDKVTIPAGTTRQIALTFKGKGTQYRLSVDRSAGQQVEDIARISRYLAGRGLAPGYVDVRIAGKAFYK